MKISAILHTGDYRGDHTADVEIALDVDESETLSELFYRAYSVCHVSQPDALLGGSDKIVLRLIK